MLVLRTYINITYIQILWPQRQYVWIEKQYDLP